MKNLSEIKPHASDIEVYEMTNVRLIGKYKRNTHFGDTTPSLWDECFADGSMDILKGLPSIIPNAFLGWLGDYTPNDKTIGYVVGVLAPAGTPVPEGFICKDFTSPMFIADCLIDLDINDKLDRINKLGFKSPFCSIDCVGWWEGELYLDGYHPNDGYNCLMPVVKIDNCTR